ncbi:MarR family transcriptional regulator, partial [Streptomyces achromogenes]|uniref:MarR family winged helix-turn-helix transcriptional regulator n=1 Tax=Streptomyces achromogenes TaxID=67255 RepID=UPI003402FE1D
MAAKNAERGLVEQWREILSLHARTQCELDRVLHGHGLCASDFEVLDVLAEGVASGGNCAYRVQEIADRVHLSQSALSRLIARLEKDGLVERIRKVADGHTGAGMQEVLLSGHNLAQLLKAL